jgi:hypothetical protein
VSVQREHLGLDDGVGPVRGDEKTVETDRAAQVRARSSAQSPPKQMPMTAKREVSTIGMVLAASRPARRR